MIDSSANVVQREDGTYGVCLGKIMEQVGHAPAWAYDVVMSSDEARKFAEMLQRSVDDATNPDLADTTYTVHVGNHVLTFGAHKGSANMLHCGNCDYGTDHYGFLCSVCHGHSDTPRD